MDQDTLDKLASGEYSISPRTGRLRKRVRLKKEKGVLHKSKIKSLLNTILWVVLIAAFLVSLVMIVPEMKIPSGKKRPGTTKIN